MSLKEEKEVFEVLVPEMRKMYDQHKRVITLLEELVQHQDDEMQEKFEVIVDRHKRDLRKTNLEILSIEAILAILKANLE